MERYQTLQPFFIEGRKQPFSYLLGGETPPLPDLRVLGHYETACGGCDTISSPDLVYKHIEQCVAVGENVLYEGIIIGDDVTRCVALSKTTPVKVICLNTPLDVCLAGIQARRDARGDDRPLNPANTESRAKRLKTSMAPRLKAAGVDVVWMSREEALVECLKLLGVE
jgi:hypothetical protein